MRLHDNYNYEAAFNQQMLNLEDFELLRNSDEYSKGLQYCFKETVSGKLTEIDGYPALLKRPYKTRAPREAESSTRQKGYNEKRARRYLNQLISANFGEGDYFITFTYKDSAVPSTIEEAEKKIANFIRCINKARKKAGLDNSIYIYITEGGFEKGEKRIHHHLIIDGALSKDLLIKKWRHGTLAIKNLYAAPETHYKKLTDYIQKDPKGKKRWKASQGLKKPIVKKQYIKHGNRHIESMLNSNISLGTGILKNYKNVRMLCEPQVFRSGYTGGLYLYLSMIRD